MKHKDEIIEQMIHVAGIIILVYVTKKMMSPDFGRTFRMKSALTMKRIADQQVREWEKVASHAATVYHKSCAL